MGSVPTFPEDEISKKLGLITDKDGTPLEWKQELLFVKGDGGFIGQTSAGSPVTQLTRGDSAHGDPRPVGSSEWANVLSHESIFHGVLCYSGWSHTAEGWAASKSSNVLQTIPKEYVDAMKKKFKLK